MVSTLLQSKLNLDYLRFDMHTKRHGQLPENAFREIQHHPEADLSPPTTPEQQPALIEGSLPVFTATIRPKTLNWVKFPGK